MPFIKALEGLGFATGRNIAIEYHFAEGQDERLPELAAELVRRQVVILVANCGEPSPTAASNHCRAGVTTANVDSLLSASSSLRGNTKTATEYLEVPVILAASRGTRR